MKNDNYHLYTVVFGWSSSRGLDAVPRGTFTAVEQDERYVLPVGFIKGGIFAILWNELEFSIGVREGTATGMSPVVHTTALDIYSPPLHPSQRRL